MCNYSETREISFKNILFDFFYHLIVIMNIIMIVDAKTKRYENVNLMILFNLTINLLIVLKLIT